MEAVLQEPGRGSRLHHGFTVEQAEHADLRAAMVANDVRALPEMGS